MYNTKIVYVVTSTPKDIYLEQALVSITSLRLHMPKGSAFVTLLIDNKTNDSLIGSRASIKELIDELIVIDYDDNMSMYDRSRYLKTGLREYVKGDVLYIDCDTIIARPFDGLDDFDFNLGSVLNCHVPFNLNPYRDWHESQAKQIGFRSVYNETDYFNGGFCYAKDVPEAHVFFKKWRENWLKSKAKGVPNDEPGFNESNIQMNHILKKISGEWNCQLKYGLNYFSKVKVIHFLCTQYVDSGVECAYYFMDRKVYERIKNEGVIPEDIMQKIKHPMDCFSQMSMIIGGNELYLQHTPEYWHYLAIMTSKSKVKNLLKWSIKQCDRVFSLLKKINK